MQVCVLIPRELSLMLGLRPSLPTPPQPHQRHHHHHHHDHKHHPPSPLLMTASVWSKSYLRPGTVFYPDEGEVRLDRMDTMVSPENDHVRRSYGSYDALLSVQGQQVRHCNWVRFVRSTLDPEGANVISSKVRGQAFFQVTRSVKPREEIVVLFHAEMASSSLALERPETTQRPASSLDNPDNLDNQRWLFEAHQRSLNALLSMKPLSTTTSSLPSSPSLPHDLRMCITVSSSSSSSSSSLTTAAAHFPSSPVSLTSSSLVASPLTIPPKVSLFSSQMGLSGLGAPTSEYEHLVMLSMEQHEQQNYHRHHHLTHFNMTRDQDQALKTQDEATPSPFPARHNSIFSSFNVGGGMLTSTPLSMVTPAKREKMKDEKIEHSDDENNKKDNVLRRGDEAEGKTPIAKGAVSSTKMLGLNRKSLHFGSSFSSSSSSAPSLSTSAVGSRSPCPPEYANDRNNDDSNNCDIEEDVNITDNSLRDYSVSSPLFTSGSGSSRSRDISSASETNPGEISGISIALDKESAGPCSSSSQHDVMPQDDDRALSDENGQAGDDIERKITKMEAGEVYCEPAQLQNDNISVVEQSDKIEKYKSKLEICGIGKEERVLKGSSSSDVLGMSKAVTNYLSGEDDDEVSGTPDEMCKVEENRCEDSGVGEECSSRADCADNLRAIGAQVDSTVDCNTDSWTNDMPDGTKDKNDSCITNHEAASLCNSDGQISSSSNNSSTVITTTARQQHQQHDDENGGVVSEVGKLQIKEESILSQPSSTNRYEHASSSSLSPRTGDQHAPAPTQPLRNSATQPIKAVSETNEESKIVEERYLTSVEDESSDPPHFRRFSYTGPQIGEMEESFPPHKMESLPRVERFPATSSSQTGAEHRLYRGRRCMELLAEPQSEPQNLSITKTDLDLGLSENRDRKVSEEKPHIGSQAVSRDIRQPMKRCRERTWWPCDVCGKKFDRPSLLKRHTRTHTGEKPHACDVCGKAFSTSSSLNTHRRIHSGEKPHQCKICGKRFTASSNLYYHRMTHNKEKPHKCDLCSKSFPTPGDLRSHMYIHNGSWPFRCDVCNRGFSKQTNLKNHMLLHSGDKPHECPRCGKKFALLCNLKTHLKTHENSDSSDASGSHCSRCGGCSQSLNLSGIVGSRDNSISTAKNNVSGENWCLRCTQTAGEATTIGNTTANTAGKRSLTSLHHSQTAATHSDSGPLKKRHTDFSISKLTSPDDTKRSSRSRMCQNHDYLMQNLKKEKVGNNYGELAKGPKEGSLDYGNNDVEDGTTTNGKRHDIPQQSRNQPLVLITSSLNSDMKNTSCEKTDSRKQMMQPFSSSPSLTKGNTILPFGSLPPQSAYQHFLVAAAAAASVAEQQQQQQHHQLQQPWLFSSSQLASAAAGFNQLPHHPLLFPSPQLQQLSAALSGPVASNLKQENIPSHLVTADPQQSLKSSASPAITENLQQQQLRLAHQQTQHSYHQQHHNLLPLLPQASPQNLIATAAGAALPAGGGANVASLRGGGGVFAPSIPFGFQLHPGSAPSLTLASQALAQGF